MKRFAMGLATVVIAAGAAQGNEAYPYSINTHFSFPSYSGCAEAAVADGALNCGIIDTDANDYGPGQPNFVWILVGNVPPGTGPGADGGIGGIQFGMDHSIQILSWALCTGGSEIPQDDLQGTWPASGTGNAITWGGGCKLVTDNDEGLTRVGYLTVAPGAGQVAIAGDPRIGGQAQAAECNTNSIRICTQALGAGDAVVGGGGGRSTCGYKCTVPTETTSWGSLKSIY